MVLEPEEQVTGGEEPRKETNMAKKETAKPAPAKTPAHVHETTDQALADTAIDAGVQPLEFINREGEPRKWKFHKKHLEAAGIKVK